MSQGSTMSVSPISFLRLFIPIVLLLTAGAWFYGNQAIEHQLAQIRNQESTEIKLGAGALNGRVKFIVHDLMFLSRHRALRDAVEQPTQNNIAHLTEDISIFSESSGYYDQIRWIDQHGMEVVRVNYLQGKSVATPVDKLQNKGQRYFFTDTIKLSPGEVFVSPLDLNIEQDRIDVPYKPMLRIATPVSDRQGNKRGIVILNYYGKDLLKAFSDATAGIADHSMVINGDGYWLRSPSPEDEWGFMFKRPELSMKARAPVAWEHIRNAESGQIELDDGLWTWKTVYPLQAGQKSSTGAADAFAPSRGEVKYQQYLWKSVAHFPAGSLNAIRQGIWLKVSWITGMLLALLGLGSWLLSRSWEALAAEKLKFSTVADFAYDWETWLDQNGQYLYCSPSCARITGRFADDFVADPNLLLNITHPDDKARVESHLQNHQALDPPCEFDFRIVLPDGQVRWLEHACQSVFDESSKFLGRRASNRDVTERKLTEAQIHKLAFYDALTQLPNRRLLNDRLVQAMAVSSRKGRYCALMFLDLDNFKPLNDVYGHTVGDLLLVEVAHRIGGCVREEDTVARFGGDEFVVVIGELDADKATSATNAGIVAEKIRLALAEPYLLSVKQDGNAESTVVHQCTSSIGMVLFINHEQSPDDILKLADMAMYKAKESGRNQIHFYGANA